MSKSAQQQWYSLLSQEPLIVVQPEESHLFKSKEIPCDVEANVLDCNIIVSYLKVI